MRIRPDFGKCWLDLGVCHDRLGVLDRAVAAWEKLEPLAGEIPANRMLAWIYRGLAAAAGGDLDTAVGLWRRAHELDPSAVDPLRLIAERGVAAQRWTDVGWAAECWARADGKSAEAYHYAALAATVQGRAEDARLFFERSLQLDPSNPEAWRNYALLMARAGAPADAIRLLERALEIRPDYAPARDLLARLRPPADPGIR